jgi:hypothetical protein
MDNFYSSARRLFRKLSRIVYIYDPYQYEKHGQVERCLDKAKLFPNEQTPCRREEEKTRGELRESERVSTRRAMERVHESLSHSTLRRGDLEKNTGERD